MKRGPRDRRRFRKPRRTRDLVIQPHHSHFERNCLLKWTFRRRAEAAEFCSYMDRAHGRLVKPYHCPLCGCFHTASYSRFEDSSVVRSVRPMKRFSREAFEEEAA